MSRSIEVSLLGRFVNVTYDVSADVLRIVFSNLPIAESDEDKPGVILDYAANGRLVGVEILDATQRVSSPNSVEYSVVGLKSP